MIYEEVTIEESGIEIIDGDRGKNYPKKNELLPTGYCVFLNTKNIVDDRFVFSEVEFIDEKKDSLLRKGKLQRGDFVITTRGTVGNVAYYSNAVPYERIRINSGMVIVRNNNVFDPRFLYLLLKSPYVKSQFTYYSSGSAQPQLPIRDLKKVKLIKPNRKIQEKIADILGSLDDKIELNRRMNETLEQMAMVLYKHWFVDFGPFEQDNEDLPDGWKWRTLKDIAYLHKQQVDPSELEEKCPYIGLEHMPKGSISLEEWGDSSSVISQKLRFQKGDILFGKLRPYFKKVGVAPIDGVCSTDIYVLRPAREEYFGMLLGQVIQDSFIDFCTSSSSGTRMPRCDWNEMGKYPVPMAPVNVIQEFNDKIRGFVDQIIANIHENKCLIETRDYLLPRLLSGEIEVREAEEQVEEVLANA